MTTRKIATLVLFCILLLGNVDLLFAQNTTIRGHVTNFKGKLISVDLGTNPLSDKKQSFGGYIQPDGSFSIKFNLDYPVFGAITHGDHAIPIYIYPHDNMHVEVNGNNFRNSIAFSGDGEYNNLFLKMYSLKYSENAVYVSKIKEKAKLNKREYRQYVDQIRQEKKQLLASFKTKNPVSKQFEELMKAKIDYEWAVKLLDYPFEHSFFAETDMNSFGESYYSFLKEVKIQNPKAISLPAYQEVLSRFIKQKFRKTSGGTTNNPNYYAQKYEFASKHLSKQPLFFIQGEAILDACEYGKVSKIASQYKSYIQKVPYPKYTQTVKKVYENAAKLGAGQPAPNFSLTSLDGKRVSLSTFKGKVVYIDFWATWCGPCLQELGFAKDLKKYFNEKEVVFLYVSVDENEKAWRDFILKRGLNNGVHVRVNGLSSKFAKDYNIKGVPKYMLIDKYGNIADGNAKSPSSKSITLDIGRLTKK